METRNSGCQHLNIQHFFPADFAVYFYATQGRKSKICISFLFNLLVLLLVSNKAEICYNIMVTSTDIYSFITSIGKIYIVGCSNHGTRCIKLPKISYLAYCDMVVCLQVLAGFI